MDIALMITIVILIILLIAVYLLNNVPTTSNLETLYEHLQKVDPFADSYCLGYDEIRKQYKNVTRNGDDVAVIQYNDYPIGLQSTFNTQPIHGNVTDLANGYKISGIGEVTFTCPKGYEGPKCTLIPLCGPNDVDTLKPLTYTQFNGLGLFNNTFRHAKLRTKSSDEPTHPRIRVQCLRDQKYELQTCPDNKLLDEALNCIPYDVCQDRLNGYRHRYEIPPNKLESNEYYICKNNESQKATCGEGTEFSLNRKTCFTKSQCLNQGYKTIYLDDNSFIQCDKDIGKKITCIHKLEKHEKSELLTCSKAPCVKTTFEFENHELKYKYAYVNTCDKVDDSLRPPKCDNSTVDKVFQFEWVEKFQYSLRHWPKEVLDDNYNCVPPGDDIIKDDIKIDLAWSNAMHAEHPFDLKNKKYICDTAYRWDYITGEVVTKDGKPLPENSFIDSGAPCQSKLIKEGEFPWKRFNRIIFPTGNDKPPILVGVPVKFSIVRPNELWPVWDKNSKTYRLQLFSFNNSDRTIIAENYSTSVMPFGFINPAIHRTNNNIGTTKTVGTTDDYVRLLLNGFGDKPVVKGFQHQWYTIATGEFAMIRIIGDSEKIIIECPTTISTTKSGEYGIMWDFVSHDDLVVCPNFVISANGARSGNKLEAPGFTPLIIKAETNDQSVLTYGDITVKIDTSIYKTLTLP